jgi:uncharacterized protein YndB with AHSA1/START domain
MTSPEFVYTTYIKTTPEKVWAAITNSEFASQYWGGLGIISDCKKGSKWKLANKNRDIIHWVGEVVESVPSKRLVLTWINPANEADVSRVTFEIEAIEDMVCLNVVHGDFTPDFDTLSKISSGWPRVLSSLKSFLETDNGINVKAGKTCATSAEKGAPV